MVPNLVYEYSHLETDGIDHHLFSELCSFRIINNFSALSRYQNIRDSPRKAKSLTKYIASIIHCSKLGVNIAVAAMIVIERFQERLTIPATPFMEEMEDAGCLFLIGYIIAAKVIEDDHHPSWFWKKVSNYQYTVYDLNRLELQFYKVMGWKAQINREAFNESFIGMMDSYHSHLESQKLPSAPPPVYQRVKKNETSRKHVAFLTEIGGSITILDNEGEALSRITGQPQRALNMHWSKSRFGSLRAMLRKTPFSFHDEPAHIAMYSHSNDSVDKNVNPCHC